MSDAVKELIIRIKRDDAQALASQRAYHAAERKGIQRSLTDAEVAERAKTEFLKRENRQRVREAARASKTTVEQIKAEEKAADAAAAAARQMTKALLGQQVAGAALNMVKQGIDAIAQSAAEARARIAAMNAAAAAARFGDREVAALTGNKATVAFSASLAGQAAQAGVSPEVYRQAQTAFQAQAGQFVGSDALAKVSQEDASDLLQRVSSFSASQGVNVADSAKLMGTIIGKSAKGTNKQDLMTTFGKVFRGVQLAPGETGPLLNQLSELIQEEVGQGGSFNSVLEALPLIRVMAERNPGEASTYGRALIRGLRDINSDPSKMAQVGITGGMSFMEQVQAVDKAATASGDEGSFLNKFFPDIRSFGGVRTALNAGTRGGGFARAARDMAGVTDEAISGVIRDYLGGEEGRAQTAASREEQARLEQAASPGMRLLAEARARASTSLEASGDLNRGEGLGAIWTGFGHVWGLGGRKEQEETSLVGTELAQRLSGYPGGREWMRRNSMTPGVTPFSLGSRAAPESSMVEGFKLLSDLRDAARALKDAGDAIKQTKPPVPPPAPAKPPAIGRP